MGAPELVLLRLTKCDGLADDAAFAAVGVLEATRFLGVLMPPCTVSVSPPPSALAAPKPASPFNMASASAENPVIPACCICCVC